MLAVAMEIREEVAKRRTFAIISHPDAGKTTLTEKLLLYGGAILTAGPHAGRPRARARRDLGLDGARTRARDLDHLDGAPVSISRAYDELARHPGSPRFRRGHVPHAARRRLGGDADRRRQGRRAADAQTVRDLSRAAYPAVHLHQQ